MPETDRSAIQVRDVMDFYTTRTTSKMNVAMERLALLTALVMPVTALASIYGMNIIVNQRTQPAQLAVVLSLIGLTTSGMLWWTRRLGWW